MALSGIAKTRHVLLILNIIVDTQYCYKIRGVIQLVNYNTSCFLRESCLCFVYICNYYQTEDCMLYFEAQMTFLKYTYLGFR